MSDWTRVCVLCARRNPPRRRELETGHVCAACQTGLDVDLAALVDAAAHAAEPGPVDSPLGAVGGGKPGSRPPLEVARLDPAMVLVTPPGGEACDAQPLLVALEDWCRIIREDRGFVPYGVATEGEVVNLSTVVGFLRTHVAWMCTEPTFAVEDFSAWVRRGLRALRGMDAWRPPDPSWGVPCPADAPETSERPPQSDEQAEVGTELPPRSYEAVRPACGFKLRVKPGDLHGSFRCPQCHADWTAQRLLLVALNDPRVTIWAYPSDIDAALGIPDRTLRRWAGEGTIARQHGRYDAGAAFRRRHEQAAC